MGLIERFFTLVFGGGRNAVVETAHVFRENAEASASRDAAHKTSVLAQFGEEFQLAQGGRFDRFIDAVNPLSRPAMALGTLGLFVAAMVDPIWFAARMQGLALAPEPLWWLLGAIVSFYFGARHQMKGQEFQRSIAASMALTPSVAQNLSLLNDLTKEPHMTDGAVSDILSSSGIDDFEENAALEDWRSQYKGQAATM